MLVRNRFKFIALALAGLVSSAQGSIYTVKPTLKDSFRAGQSFTVTWTSDLGDTARTARLAADFGRSSVGIYTGSASQQSLVQHLGAVDPAKIQELPITINGTAGPDSSLYFIRFDSYKSTDKDGHALQAFSSRFSLTNMNGAFSAAQIKVNEGVVEFSASASTLTSGTSARATSATLATTPPSTSSGSLSSTPTTNTTLAASPKSTGATGEGRRIGISLGVGVLTALMGATVLV